MDFINRDITTVTHGIVIQQVNCQGAMNSGVAKAIREWQPGVFTIYKMLCNVHSDDPSKLLGKCLMYSVPDNPHLLIGNIFGQLEFGTHKIQTNLEALSRGMHIAYETAADLKLPIHTPMIGCGLGGADFETDVKPLIHACELLHGVNTTVFLVG